MNKKLVRNFIFVGLIALVVCGNFLTVLAAETYTWEEKASMNIGRNHFDLLVCNEKVYAIGGHTSPNMYLDSIESYNSENNSWEVKANMNYGRHSYAVASYNNKIYVFGGMIENIGYSNTVECYDTDTNSWVFKSNMPKDRAYGRAVVAGNKVYLIGGRDNDGFVNQVDVYCTDTDTWTIGSNIPNPRMYNSTALIDSKIYVFGGLNTDHESKVDVYNTENDTWTSSIEMTNPLRLHQTVVINNKIYVIGGMNRDGEFLKDIIEYNPDSNEWSNFAQIDSDGIVKHGCTVIGNRILLAGGAVKKNGIITEHVNNFYFLYIVKTPTNLTATPGNAQVLLSWDTVAGADSYTVKRATTQGGPYTTIAENITETSYLDTSVVNGTTYYYVVTAVNTVGESAPSNEAFATPIAPVVNRALLNITMHDSLSKEYDLSMTQVNSFIDWYNSSTGSELYTVEKAANIGPFLSRKDYLVKGKIVCFEIMEYENVQ